MPALAHAAPVGAHPVLFGHDELIPRYADLGLDAIEAFHPDHGSLDTTRYLHFARELGLLVTGGSDFHGDDRHQRSGPGSVTLPKEHFERLMAARA